ncbi:glutathione S-transferase family protein [Spongiibacter nanhainus]|uniref:Glutathione S-transferase family protein n=1 Tax=Spongiibacter nanhainus TaxID=2794344 RepID=A0A7T4R056_9GAMM|nr:glutathione S-transferase family protein [Spongiibacter nanhainus]QQD17985.1 glutathione S-transferase family protein [Spongiibacter nanhainus]
MGLLVNGEWRDKWYNTEDNGGEFKRESAQCRGWIGDDRYPAESGRYHLYVSLACPWAHRTLIFRELKQLQDHISVSVVSPLMLEQGWSFDTEQGSSGDALYNSQHMHQIYTRHQSDYTGRVTVPVLWDKQREEIVSNESADIIRMFNSAFDDITGNREDYYPVALREEIDAVNERVYHTVNNGVYRAGFATAQDAYEKAYGELFDTLDFLEQRLAQQRYLAGAQLTEADWRLFTTLIRFDAVYHGHFKCNRQRLAEFPNLSNYLRELYQQTGVADTVDFDHIKRHYYISHPMINPTQIVPAGPQQDFSARHDRHRL